MKIINGHIEIESHLVEDILHNGLRVLILEDLPSPCPDGALLIETNKRNPTGRIFPIAIPFCFELYKVIQIIPGRFMYVKNPDGTNEAYPMTGEFAAEKVSLPNKPPEDFGMDFWRTEITGEKPAWFYNGEKFVQEIALNSMTFDTRDFEKLKNKNPGSLDTLLAPKEVTVKITGSKGDIYKIYKA